jgi:diguanylate cyclase (GGDEF)-like protein
MKSNYSKLLTIHAVIAALGTVLLTVFFVIYVISGYSHAEDTQKEHMRILASNAASRAQTLFGSLVVTMRLLDTWIADNPEKDPRFDPTFTHLVDAYRDFAGKKIDIRAVDESGGLYYFPSASTKPLANASDREYYQTAKNLGGETLHFAEPVLSRITGKWGIPISYQLRPNRHGLLAIFAVVEFGVLDETFSDLLENPDQSVDIVRDDRLVLSRTPYNEALVGKPLEFNPGTANYEVIVVDTAAFGEGKDRFRAVYSKRLERLPVYMLVADSHARMRQEGLRSLLPGAIGLFAMIAAFVALNLQLFRYLRKNKRFQAELERSVRTDFLTGLKNRQYFFERAEGEIGRARRAGTRIVMLVLDIDDFKRLNDTYGHPAGDVALREIAANIAQSVRSVDHAGRIGGEEFAVLLPETDMETGVEVAERIRKSMGAVAHGAWQAGISVGAAEWAGPEETIDELFARADAALYEAKAAGKNRVMRATSPKAI